MRHMGNRVKVEGALPSRGPAGPPSGTKLPSGSFPGPCGPLLTPFLGGVPGSGAQREMTSMDSGRFEQGKKFTVGPCYRGAFQDSIFSP